VNINDRVDITVSDKPEDGKAIKSYVKGVADSHVKRMSYKNITKKKK